MCVRVYMSVFVCVCARATTHNGQWLAVPFDSGARERSLQTLGVQGIPMLSVMGANGQMLLLNDHLRVCVCVFVCVCVCVCV